MDTLDRRMVRILMFPWLAYSHIHTHLELAKKLSSRNFYIYICSTPANLGHIKEKVINYPSIQLVELHLPSLPQLPPHHHTTKALPRDLIGNLMQAFDMASGSFSSILTTLKPDLLVSDFFQPWAPALASSLNIPTVQFVVSGNKTNCMLLNALKNSSVSDSSLHSSITDLLPFKDRVVRHLEPSSTIMLARSLGEIEGKYLDDLSVLAMKKIVVTGPLVPDPTEEIERTEITEWLDKKEPSSVVFVSFGTECYLSRGYIEEVAHGLLLSNVSFIWVLRFPQGEQISVTKALPDGFMDIVGERGLVIDWAPQKRILSHRSIGGFLSHCGWSSVLESMKFGVPIIALPMYADQPLNAEVVVEIGAGLEIKKDGNGKVEREEMAKVIKEVVVAKTGENLRRKARELSDCVRKNGDKQIDDVANELVRLCGI